MIRVQRRGYKRRDGTYVKPTVYMMKDTGKRGRTPMSKRVIPIKKGTHLGIDFDMESEERRGILRTKTKRFGEKEVGGKLRAVQILNKRTNPEVSKKAASDAKYIFGAFKGRKLVGKGRGFSRK